MFRLETGRKEEGKRMDGERGGGYTNHAVCAYDNNSVSHVGQRCIYVKRFYSRKTTLGGTYWLGWLLDDYNTLRFNAF